MTALSMNGAAVGRNRRRQRNAGAGQAALRGPAGPERDTQAQTIAGGYQLNRPWPVLGLSLLSLVLTLPLFAPWSWWPLGYVAFVPWLVGIGLAGRARWAYLGSYLLGAGFFFVHLHWLYTTTAEGYVALCLVFLNLFFVLAAWPIRYLYRTRKLPMTLVFPVVWTAVETLRAHNPLAFPWFLLGHSQIRVLSLVQVADLGGVAAVTFVTAMVNGCIVDLLLKPIRMTREPGGRWRFRPGFELPATLLVVAASMIYGWYRLGQPTGDPGPKVAVVQGDFLLYTTRNPQAATDAQKRSFYLDQLTKAAATAGDLDLVVLPETPWDIYLNEELVGIAAEDPNWGRYLRMRRLFVDLATKLRTHVIVGAMSIDPQPAGSYPDVHRYNSAFLFTPAQEQTQRYDKIHLVPFGEYVPFRYTSGLHWLYRLLNDGPWNPWGRPQEGGPAYEYSLTRGHEHNVFTFTGRDGRRLRCAVTICYEDVIPQVFRRFVADAAGHKRVDFMLNISNDGWFGHGAQQAQHLVNCAFRAIENRVAVARSVNTGISGFIDSRGAWHDLVQAPDRRLHAGGAGYTISRMGLDPRVSLYSRFGDVFGALCGAVALIACGLSVANWRAGRRRSRSPGSKTT